LTIGRDARGKGPIFTSDDLGPVSGCHLTPSRNCPSQGPFFLCWRPVGGISVGAVRHWGLLIRRAMIVDCCLG